MILEQKYDEALHLPKFAASLERLINKYSGVMSEHHVGKDALLPLLEQVTTEGNDFIVQWEYCGYVVMVWHDRLITVYEEIGE